MLDLCHGLSILNYMIVRAAAIKVVVTWAGKSERWLKANHVIHRVPVASENALLITVV